MSSFCRNIQQLTNEQFDLIIIGGGIHGVMMAYEATLRNLKVLLVEKDDFGQHTSFNSLRIIHGGFRYLQNLGFKRLLDSYREQQWFLQNFPELVKPLPCLMPLYGNGLRRPNMSRGALLAYKMLTSFQNQQSSFKKSIPYGKVIGSADVQKNFSLVDKNGLLGGLIWYDGIIENSQRVLIDILKTARSNGATAINYFEAIDILINNDTAIGINVLDHNTGEKHQIQGNIIVNCAGPWCREVSAKYHRDEVTLFKSMLAWNVLFDRKAISDHGLAVAPKKKQGHTYFLVPWKGKLLAGTGHATWKHGQKNPWPSKKELDDFIGDINFAIPGLNLKKENILYVLPGLQSATHTNGKTLAQKEIIFNHGTNGGPKRVFSVSGIKFTTSRLVSERAINTMFPNEKKASWKKLSQTTDNKNGWDFPSNWYPKKDNGIVNDAIKSLIQDESVLHLDDFVFRRSTLFENPERAADISQYLCSLFDWDVTKCDYEKSKLVNLLFQFQNHNLK